MTRDEILNIPAGRELDALIHQKIFNKIPPREDDGSLTRSWMDSYHLYEGTFYSTNVADAWKVVEQVDVLRLTKTFGLSGVKYIVRIGNIEAFEDTASLAICRAALLITESS